MSEENKFIFAPGIITGTNIPGSARNSIRAKSLSTHLHGEAEVGGYYGTYYKKFPKYSIKLNKGDIIGGKL